MMSQVNLQFNDGFTWSHCQGISFKGYIFDENRNYIIGRQAVALFTDITSGGSLEQKIKKLDGCFTVIIQADNKLLIGVDTLSFFPLFFRFDENEWHVSDNWYSLRSPQKNFNLNTDSFPEFRSAGYILGSETLEKGTYRTLTGSVTSLEAGGGQDSKQYFHFLPHKFLEDSYSELQQQFLKVLENVTQNLVTSLEGRTAVVPLSGGYDSRIIACMLKKAGYEKVVCITYGKPGTESKISKQVADALGYEWLMIDYTKIDTRGFLNDSEFQAYYRYAGNGFAMPYLQEYFAARELKNNGMIPGDAVFIPGHPGDWLAGSYVEKTFDTRASYKHLPKWLQEVYFNFIPISKASGKILRGRLRSQLNDIQLEKHITHDRYNVYVQKWNACEKLSKFIFHSSHVFPFFGYEIRFPLWEKEMREFFRSVPFEYRKERKLYNETLEEFIFAPLGVNFPNKKKVLNIESKSLRKARRMIKNRLPMFYIKRSLRQHDYICYESFTDEMDKELITRGQMPLKRFFSFNARICHWYLDTIKRV